MQILPTSLAASSRLAETILPSRSSCHTQRASTLRARVQSQQQSSQAQEDCGPSLPEYEETTAEDGLFPKRQPGQFPQVRSTFRQGLSKIPVVSHVADSIMGTNVAMAEGVVFDPLRDGPLRYLGYANECGEAFAAWLPIWGVPGSYAVAVGYVVTDTIDKGFKAYDEARQELEGSAFLPAEVKTSRLTKILALERAMDTIVWQLLASVICPGYTIHTIVWLAHLSLLPLEIAGVAIILMAAMAMPVKIGSWSMNAQALAAVQQAADSAAGTLHTTADSIVSIADKSIPTAIGLAVIPFIVHPIDNAIHALLNASLRPAIRKYVCGPGQGSLASLDICGENCYPGSSDDNH